MTRLVPKEQKPLWPQCVGGVESVQLEGRADFPGSLGALMGADAGLLLASPCPPGSYLPKGLQAGDGTQSILAAVQVTECLERSTRGARKPCG